MKNTLLNRRIPTLLGILCITLGIWLTSQLLEKGVITIGRATPTESPQDIRLSNISDSSVTISFRTKTPVLSGVNFGKDKNLGLVASDERDEKTESKLHAIHSFNIKNLVPVTKYYFSIISGDKTFLNNNTPFEVTTASLISSSDSPFSIHGKILFPDSNESVEAIAYLNTSISQTLSTLVKPDGTYSFQLPFLRTENLTKTISIEENTKIRMLIAGTTLISNITLLSNQGSPVPPITLSKDYDFSVNSADLTPSVSSSSALLPPGVGFPVYIFTTTESKIPQFVTPKKDESFSDTKPLFSGIASPSALVSIRIESQQKIQDQIKADSNGRWTYRPNDSLTPGNHTISITSQDGSGLVKTITQSFIVLAAGSQFIEPSVSPTKPSPTPTQPITPTPTSTPIPTPTILLPTSTPFPTPSPITYPPPQKKGGGQISPPGNSSLISEGIKGIIAAAGGIVLFFITKGAMPQ